MELLRPYVDEMYPLTGPGPQGQTPAQTRRHADAERGGEQTEREGGGGVGAGEHRHVQGDLTESASDSASSAEARREPVDLPLTITGAEHSSRVRG